MASYKEVLNQALKDGKLRELTAEETEKLRAVFLRTYEDVSAVCEKYGLTLLLCGGSALGAVRHKGFIPWDDDLDTAMTRKDFDVLSEVFDRELGDRYELNAPGRSAEAKNRFPQILVKGTRFVEMGGDPKNPLNKIKIDLFIIENYPAKPLQRKLRGYRCSALMLIASAVGTYEGRNGPIREFLSGSEEGTRFFNQRKRIGRLFSFRSKQKWLCSLDKACNYRKETGTVGIPTGRKHYFGEMQPAKTFLPGVKVPFENIMAYIPADTEGYLRNLYGPDYMTLPPEEQREKHAIVEISFDA